MPHRIRRFASKLHEETTMTRLRLVSCSAALAMLVLAGPVATAHAQEAANEHRCTGQWRVTNDERIASCTVLIDSGRYQAPILRSFITIGA